MMVKIKKLHNYGRPKSSHYHDATKLLTQAGPPPLCAAAHASAALEHARLQTCALLASERHLPLVSPCCLQWEALGAMQTCAVEGLRTCVMLRVSRRLRARCSRSHISSEQQQKTKGVAWRKISHARRRARPPRQAGATQPAAAKTRLAVPRTPHARGERRRSESGESNPGCSISLTWPAAPHARPMGRACGEANKPRLDRHCFWLAF